MSDTIVVMADGEIQQIGTPTDIYNEPKNALVADFIGESNIVDGIMLEDKKVRFAGHTFECVDGGFAKNEPVDVVIRPEDVDVVPVEKGMLSGLVTGVTFKGVHYEIIVDVEGFKWMIQTTDFVAEGATVVSTIEEALAVVKDMPDAFIMGGAQIYRQTMDLVKVAHITVINSDIEGDAYFEGFNEADWTLAEEETYPATDQHPWSFSIRRYER
ncbi:MAG: dihydrofolate reductase [Burkholderiaceae bacterium]|nr:dihydrofolate reductase [Burkholderiaceae bacterium]